MMPWMRTSYRYREIADETVQYFLQYYLIAQRKRYCKLRGQKRRYCCLFLFFGGVGGLLIFQSCNERYPASSPQLSVKGLLEITANVLSALFYIRNAKSPGSFLKPNSFLRKI
jgi:hypothetical protein